MMVTVSKSSNVNGNITALRRVRSFGLIINVLLDHSAVYHEVHSYSIFDIMQSFKFIIRVLSQKHRINIVCLQKITLFVTTIVIVAIKFDKTLYLFWPWTLIQH